jgi:AAT family amino acid transporter
MTGIFYLLKMEKRVPLDDAENENGTKPKVV